jgi:protein SCO1
MLKGLGWALALGAPFSAADAQVLMKEPPKAIRGLDVFEQLGEKLPADLTFTTSDNRTVALGDYFKQPASKPTIVALVYYSCPTVCSVVLSKLATCLEQLDYTLGKDFNCLVFGFKDEETVIHAAGAKARYTSEYKSGGDALAGWQFHVGQPETTQKLADALGFQYRRLDDGEYAHPVALFIVTPDGTIARYIYGFDYKPAEMKLALLEASNGDIAQSIGDRFLHFCYRYDPTAGTYTLQAFRVMQIGGIVAVVGVGSLIIALRVGESLRKRRAAQAGVPLAHTSIDSDAVTGMAR